MDGNGHVQDLSSSPPPSVPAVIASDTLPSSNSDSTKHADTAGSEELPQVSLDEDPRVTVHEFLEEQSSEPQLSNAPHDAVPEVAIEPSAYESGEEELPPPTPAKNDVALADAPPPPPPDRPITFAANGNARLDSRPQSPAPSTTGGSSANIHRRSMTTSKGPNMSVVLISSALESIAASREAKRSAPLKDGIQKALELIQTNQASDRPREILEPLRLACETHNEKLIIASLDCISKLISYSFFADDDIDLPQNATPPPSPGPHGRRSSLRGSQVSIPQPSLVDLVAQTIASCHNETTSDTVSVQIVKALLGLVLSQSTIVHHHSLLQSIRTVYNVYILSGSPAIQILAQGSLTQMVDHIFNRCEQQKQLELPNASVAQPSEDNVIPQSQGSAQSPPQSENGDSDGHDDQESSSKMDSPANVAPSLQLPADDEKTAAEAFEHGSEHGRRSALGSSDTLAPTEIVHQLSLHDLFLKDAFLVFRALCKLSMKPLTLESEHDPKSHAYRNKVMALQLILHVLNSHMALFVDPTSIIYSSSSHETPTFVQQITQHLCLALSRNAVSPIPQVFEISVEIFWRVLSGMRTKLKKEIEVLLHEIFIPILEMKTSTLKQKAVILGMLSRLCQDPQALVEIYLNYDCDREAADNIYEHLMNIVSKFGTSSAPPLHNKASEPSSPALSPVPKGQAHAVNSLNASILSVSGTMDTSTLGLSEAQLKRQALECLVAVLRSLVAWGTATPSKSPEETAPPTSARSQGGDEPRRDTTSISERLTIGSAEALRQPTPEPTDDPSRFETAKQRKTTLLEGIKKFNFKPKRGIQFLIENGFIPSDSPNDIAAFLHETDGLNKGMLGEYLGEGDPQNIDIMHAFVDMMDFRDRPFVDSIRQFLQSFRLPGEAQKIDRFLLKFAERYIAGNAKTDFANADAAYVLGYSVILLNTDAHNPQIKRRMTKADFVKNNRGINDGADLPEEMLLQIYDDIHSNEIVMNDEIEAKLLQGSTGLTNALTSVGRDLQKEAYVLQTSGMSNKTETLLTTMRNQRKNSKGSDQFFSASHFVHVRPMFEVAWMPFLAGLSGPLQETDDLEVVELCLDGFRNAIRIVCFFDLELQRNAFVTTLAKFTFLNNLGEMKIKNMEAIKALLDVAVNDGNNLRASWREVLTCVSQLEHMQLISNGVDVPDPGKKGRTKKLPNEELANESRSTHITVAADMVFSLSHYLSGTAIVDFVRALCAVSWEEIQSSGLSQHPRIFSLQKLVDISYYNMNRIRLEWSNLWEILGEHFNHVCCHNNPHVGFFALDALRQLAMRFLEKEELPHFKFQKDFLKPFEYTMVHNQNPDVRDMVLQCLQQMIQARVHNLRSGWRTMFGVFSAASKVLTERIVNSAFEIVTRLNKEHFSPIVKYGAFADLTVCITEFCKVSKYQKISLLAIAMLRGIIPIMLQTSECSLKSEHQPQNPDQPMDEAMIKYWFPVLFGFYDIIMNAEDLEVRRLALDSLFTTLKTYGSSYPVEFWDTVCQELLFPIFAVLKSSQDISRFSTQEDMSVWLSSTMIQALRDLIDLYTFYFDILERMLDGLLDLLCVCICQENNTLSRIGTSCLQQFLESNVKKLSPARWEKITSTFIRLFRTTTPHQLFDDNLRTEIDVNGNSPESAETVPGDDGITIVPAPLSPNPEQAGRSRKMTHQDRQRIFNQIIIKCILQLLLIETTSDLLRNDDFYNTIPPDQLLKLMGILDHSYQFARMFNEDKELRTGLWKVGFMKHLPNLLKQESTSASTLVHVLLLMYYDGRPDYYASRPQVAERLLPLGLGVLDDYNKLRPDTQGKNIVAWNPVVAEILDGFNRFDDKAFSRYLPAIYPLAVELLSRDVAPEIRVPLRTYFARVGYAQGIVDAPS